MSRNRPVSDDVVARVERAARIARRRRQAKRAALREAAAREPLDWRQQHHDAAGLVGRTREGHDVTPLHGPAVARSPVQIPDDEGRRGYPFRADSVLAVLQRNGSIDQTARLAGERFTVDFAQAALSGYPSRDLMHAIRGTRRDGGPPATIAHARDRVWAALGAVGGASSPVATALWGILGMGQSIKETAGQMAVNARTVSGMLTAACYALAAHYTARDGG